MGPAVLPLAMSGFVGGLSVGAVFPEPGCGSRGCCDLQAVERWFFHAQKISAFAFSKGFRTLSHMILSGVPAPFYHYACYVAPATLCSLGQTTAYQAFGCFLVPLGVVLAGLAAFVLISFFWGPWAGLSACVVLFLIPDPLQLWAANHWLSYHWQQQISPERRTALP